MKRNLKITAIFIVIAMVLSIMGVTNAASATMACDSTSSLSAGGNVEYTLKITALDAPDGLDFIQGTLDFSDTIFDNVKKSDITPLNSWTISEYNQNNHVIIFKYDAEDDDGNALTFKTTGDIAKVKLKVKAGITDTSADVGMKDISATTGTGASTIEFQIGNASKTVTKASATPTPTPTPTPTGKPSATPTPTPTGKPSATPTPTPTKTPSGSSNSGSSSSGSSSSGSSTSGSSNSGAVSGKLPQTGESALMITASIALVSTMAGIGYFKFKRIDK